MMQNVPCVTALLVNRQGQVLLQQRDDKPTIAFPGCWTTLGGRVEPGETAEAAMHRELAEEIERDSPLLLWTVYTRPGPPNVSITQYVYLGVLDDPASHLPLHEGQALRWISGNDLPTLAMPYGFEALCQEFFAEYGRDTLFRDRLHILRQRYPKR